MQSIDIHLSIQAISIDYLVWRVSGILVNWALLYTSSTNARCSTESFLRMNKLALIFDCASIKGDATLMDPQYVPRQLKPSYSQQKADNPYKKKQVHKSAPNNVKKGYDKPRKEAVAAKPVGSKAVHEIRPPAKKNISAPLTSF